jgi:UDP-N-acetylmuramoylalanine--D-glutamate ligase
MNFLRDLHVLVLGLGDSGLAMARWCVRCGAASVSVADTRATPPGAGKLADELPGVRLVCGAFTPALLAGPEPGSAVQLLLKSPGLSPLAADVAALIDAAAERGVLALGELTLFAHALKDLKAARGYAPRVIAITGTNGKTTTTALTAQLLERCGWRVGLAGNIGPTLLDTLGAALDLEPVAALQADAPVPETAAAAVDAVSAAAGMATLVTSDPSAAPDADAVPEAAVEPVTEPTDADMAAAAAVAPVVDEPGAGAEAEAVDIERIGGGPPAHLIPPPPPGPVFEHLPDAWVVELSSFQLDGVTLFEPSSATVLNLTQDHLDWHGDMAAYAAAKARIFGPADTSRAVATVMVLNRDDPAVLAMVPTPAALPAEPLREPGRRAPAKLKPARFVPRTLCSFGLDLPRVPGDFGLLDEGGMVWLVRAHPLDPVEAAMLCARGRNKAAAEHELLIQRLMPADALRIRGRHNAANALAALALATAAGAPLAPMLHGLREYRGEPHRVEFIAILDGVEAYDDSKGTNVGATVAALDGLGLDKAPGKLVVILGGDGKGQDFTPLAAPLARRARAVALIGRDAAAIRAAVQADCDVAGVPMVDFDDLPAATRWCFEQARSGDAVLLSPACASLDMFRNYAHRAEVFVDSVRELAAEHGEVIE